MAHNEMNLMLGLKRLETVNATLATQISQAYHSLRHVTAVALYLLKDQTLKLSKEEFEKLLNYADDGLSIELRDVEGTLELRVVQVPVEKPEAPPEAKP